VSISERHNNSKAGKKHADVIVGDMRPRKQPVFVEQNADSSGDVHWALTSDGRPNDFSEETAIRITPQLYWGTARGIQTVDPSLIRIKYKVFYHPYDCSGHGDRRYFYVLENAYQKNTPATCYFIPDCVCLYGSDSIEHSYFDRGAFDQQNICFRTNCVGGTPKLFVNERKCMCLCCEVASPYLYYTLIRLEVFMKLDNPCIVLRSIRSGCRLPLPWVLWRASSCISIRPLVIPSWC